MKNRVEIKSESKALLRTARVNPLVMTAIFLVIGYVLDRVVTLVETGSLFPSAEFLQEYYQALASSDVNAMLALAGSLPTPTPASTFFSILVGLFMMVLSAGYSIYCMGIRQGAEMPYTTLFDGLGVAGKVILCSLLVTIKVFLWSMLLFIPGIVAAYRYRFAIYNILTDDSLTAGQAIRLSCQQTRGMKGRLFVLDLSFWGWSILSSLTMGILDIWLTPYRTMCDLSYFEEGQIRLGRSPYGGSDPAEDL